MKAARFQGYVSEQGKLKVRGALDLPEGPVEVIVLSEEPKQKKQRRRRPLRSHPFVDMWANREDIRDSGEYARLLRRELETRANRK